MGQKTNPKALRLGIIQDWDCNWFATADYSKFLLQDFKIRSFLKRELDRAGVARIVMNRKTKYSEAVVHVARPGVIFGRNGIDLKILKETVAKEFGVDIKITILELKNPDKDSKLVGEWVTFQIEKRVPFRRVMKMAVQKALKAGALGIKIECSGRLGGVEIARTEWYREGKVPLHTFRADIDYSFSEAITTYGKIGVKVWVYNGEILPSGTNNNVAEVVG